MEVIYLEPEEIISFQEFLKSENVQILKKEETETEEIIICNTDQKFIIKKTNNIENIIFGKDKTSGVVSVEITGNQAILFLQKDDGQVVTEIRPHRYWYLTQKPITENAKRLAGNLNYRWINFVDSEEEYDSINLFKINAHKIYDKKEMNLLRSGITYYKGLKHNKVSILAFDIETNGIQKNKDSLVLLIANTYRNSKGDIQKKLFSYDDYSSQKELINAWCSWVRETDPSIICGHNIYTFDLPFLQHVAELYETELSLGRSNRPILFNERESRFRKDGSQFIHYNKAHIFGREIVDTFFLSIKYDVGRNFENYKLKSIIKQLGLEKTDRQFYDASKIQQNYKNKDEFNKIKAYAEDDGDDALVLYDLMAPAYFYMTQSIPKSFQSVIESASGSQINSIMVRSYLAEDHSIPDASEAKEFEGAISLGNPGIYDNCFKVDVVSLYPSIMRQYKVYDSYKDPRGNFLKLTEYFSVERIKNKDLAKKTNDKYYDDIQASQKIFINSAYGFLGAAGLNFNSPTKAAFVTEMGRNILTKTIEWAESKGFHIVNADTDSITFTDSGKEFSKETRMALLRELNSLFPEKISFDDDGFFRKVIVLKAKNYLLWDGTKIKTKGSALKSSTKSVALKEFMQTILDSILNGKNNYTEIYNTYILEAMNVLDIKRWAGKKTYTDKIDESERTNEVKVKTALQGSEYREGDKFYVFYQSDDSLCLIENFNGDYNKERLIKALWDTSQSFKTIIPPEAFPKYHLKKNKILLEQLLIDNNLTLI